MDSNKTMRIIRTNLFSSNGDYSICLNAIENLVDHVAKGGLHPHGYKDLTLFDLLEAVYLLCNDSPDQSPQERELLGKVKSLWLCNGPEQGSIAEYIHTELCLLRGA